MYFVFSLTTVMLCWIPNWIFTPEISAGDLIIIVLVPTISLESLVNQTFLIGDGDAFYAPITGWCQHPSSQYVKLSVNSTATTSNDASCLVAVPTKQSLSRSLRMKTPLNGGFVCGVFFLVHIIKTTLSFFGVKLVTCLSAPNETQILKTTTYGEGVPILGAS